MDNVQKETHVVSVMTDEYKVCCTVVRVLSPTKFEGLYKSENGCTYGRTCFFRHVEAEEKPSKKSKKGGAKGSVALLYTIGLCMNVVIQTRRQNFQGHLTPS